MLKWLKKLFTKEAKIQNAPVPIGYRLSQSEYKKHYEGKGRTIGIYEPFLGPPSVRNGIGSWEYLSNNNNKNENI